MGKTNNKKEAVCKTYEEYLKIFFPSAVKNKQFTDIQPFRLGVTLARRSLEKHKALLVLK